MRGIITGEGRGPKGLCEYLDPFLGDPLTRRFAHPLPRRILEVNYEPTKRWVEYRAHLSGSRLHVDKTEYGDWCGTASMDGKGSDRGATSRPLIGTAACYLNTKLMARGEQRPGKRDDEKHYTDLAARIRDGSNQRLFNRLTAQCDGAAQASLLGRGAGNHQAYSSTLFPKGARGEVI